MLPSGSQCLRLKLKECIYIYIERRSGRRRRRRSMKRRRGRRIRRRRWRRRRKRRRRRRKRRRRCSKKRRRRCSCSDSSGRAKKLGFSTNHGLR